MTDFEPLYCSDCRQVAAYIDYDASLLLARVLCRDCADRRARMGSA